MTEIIQELALIWDNVFFEGDLAYEDGLLAKEQGLMSAVIISLFTDRRASIDDTLPDFNSTDRRGWWGDLAKPEVEGDKIGSLLWLLERAKTETSVLTKAQRYVEESLEWLIEDNIASAVEVEVTRQGVPGTDRLEIRVRIIMVEGNAITIKLLAGVSGG